MLTPASADPAAEPKKDEGQPPAAPESKGKEELDAINQRLAELQKSLSGAKDTKEIEDRQKAFQDKYKLDNEQIAGVQEIVESAVSTALANVNRGTGEDRAKAKLGNAAPTLMPQVSKIMATYPAKEQGNPAVWEQVAQYVIGANVDVYTKANTTLPAAAPEPQNAARIRGANVNGFQRNSPTNPAGPSSTPRSVEEQATIDRNHGGNAEEYDKFKNSSEVVGKDYYDPNRGKPKFS